MNIIQTWKTKEIPIQYYKFIENLKQHCSDFNFLFFTDEDILEFMKNKMPQYQKTFGKLSHKIQQLDFFRYLAVYYYGGIYLDLDVLVNHSLKELYDTPEICKFPVESENNNDIYFKKQDVNYILGNYAFYAPAKHPFIKEIIDNIVNPRLNDMDIHEVTLTNGDSDEQVYVYCTTGPILVTQTYVDSNLKNKIELLRTQPFKNDRFGIYGQHCCHGTWKRN